MSNYIIVLFKNRKKRKIIKCYTTEKNATSFFKKLVKENKEIIFDRKIENATPVNYHIGLLTNQSNVQNTLHFVDDLGRNHVANLQDKDYVFIDIEKYNVEEKIYDYQLKDKISFSEFLKKYCSNNELKNIFSLNNKICIQINETISLFSLKDIDESFRFLNILEKHFYENSRMDAIIVRDVSNAQRKWIYSVLEEMGFDKKNLYRQKTTFSKR
jgi:hypothetical protein